MPQTGPKYPPPLLRDTAKAIAPYGLALEALPTYPDVRITHPDGQTRFIGAFKNHLTTGNIGPVLAEMGRLPKPVILIADYINPPLAEHLKERGIFFLDAAGNAFLKDPGLFVWVTGRRNQAVVQERQKKVRAFQPTGLKLIFAILCDPKLIEADYRTLARTAGIALGNVGWVFRDLVDGGFVRRIGRDRRLLVEPRKLLDRWTTAFVEQLRPKLLLDRFAWAKLEDGGWRKTDVLQYGALWGGEPAGALLTKHLRPGTLTLYAGKTPPQLIADERLRRDDRGALEIRRKFWHFEQQGGLPGVVPPVLAYADLMAIGDGRTIETANRVFDDCIHGYFAQYLARAAG